MGNDAKITFGSKAVSAYEKTGKKVLENCQNILKNANVPIPIVNSDNNGDKKLTGVVLEHADDVNPAKSSEGAEVQKEEQTVVAQEPTEAPNEQKNSEKEKDDKSKQNYKESSTSKANFTNSNSTVHNTYTKFSNKVSQLSSKDSLKDYQRNGLNSVNDVVNVMEDIEAAGQSHIDALEEELPDNGLVEGSVTSSYQSSVGEQNFSLEVNIKNSWQNKKKNFGIVASASFGYEQSNTTDKTFDIDDEDFEGIYNDDNDENENNIKNAVVKAHNLKTSDSPEIGELTDDVPSEDILGTSKSRVGNFSLNLRYKKGDFIYGGGLASEFSADKSQRHDQFVTVKNISTNISADLMRRTHITYDPETGERVSKAEMKLKLDLLNRGKKENINNYEEKSQDEIINEQAQLAGNTETDDLNTENNDENTSGIIKNEEIEEAEADAQTHKVKDGSGWDVDFKYDGTVCGIGAEYGINLINNPKSKERLTVAPLGGIYDYNPPSDNASESFKYTLGVASEYKKAWDDGKSVNASLSVIANRTLSKGNAPKDLAYAIFSGNYKNPRKKLNVDLDAGIIKSDATIAYIEAGASKQFKNFNVKGQIGYTHTNYGVSKENTVQAVVTGTYNIPYGKKNK